MTKVNNVHQIRPKCEEANWAEKEVLQEAPVELWGAKKNEEDPELAVVEPLMFNWNNKKEIIYFI